MTKVRRLVMLNQMAGPMFRELAEGLSIEFKDGCVLHTGHPDTLKRLNKLPRKLKLVKSPTYNRKTNLSRAISWARYLLSATKLILFSERTDAFLLTTNPPLIGIWLLLFYFFKKRPYIVLVYDIYPEVLIINNVFSKYNPIIQLWNWANKKVYKYANSIITLNSSMANTLSKQNNMPLESFEVISPWVNTNSIKPIPYEENPLLKVFNPEKKHVVLYSGNMGISHDIESILEAARQLKKSDNILFLFIGGGKKYQQIIDYKNKYELINIAIFPYQSEEDLPLTMSLSSISIVALGHGLEKLMIPSKVFHYMASGAALIGICHGDNELKSIILNNNCGVCVEPERPNELVFAINDIINNEDKLMSYRKESRMTAIKYFSTNIGVSQFVSILGDKGIL